ncbi:MAG: 5-(carboxyamino)imidazole ribonucleotide mutase [Eubacteriales bacterium]
MLKTAVIMGSESDLPKLEPCFKALDKFGISYETRIISAHRTPAAAAEFASQARDRGFGVIIAVAGKAAHLGGFLAAYTTLPIIGLPIKASLEGIDALLSMVQMPAGVPVAVVAIDGAANAAILAAQILATGDTDLVVKLELFRQQMTDEVMEKDRRLQLKSSE